MTTLFCDNYLDIHRYLLFLLLMRCVLAMGPYK